MATRLTYFSNRIFNANGIADGASLYVYQTGTTTKISLYSDSSLLVPITNPVVVAAGAIIPPIYYSYSGDIRVKVLDSGGNIISDDDPCLLTNTARNVNFTGLQTGSVTRTTQAKLSDIVSAKDFGAVGDGVTDDTAAIQAALNAVGSTNGGEVILPKTSGWYRITDTLKIPAYTTLTGAGNAGYPYASGAGFSGIVADFPVTTKWVIEAGSTNSGASYAYNVMVTGALPSSPAYNCCIRNLSIRSVNTIPYGGVRIHGAPGAVVENVSVTGVGCGFLLNYSFGCKIRINAMGYYYGAAAWDDVNGCSLDIYAAQDQSVPSTVPTAYQLPFMTATAGTLVGSRAMSVEHNARPYGLLMGSTSSASINNEVSAVIERFKGGVFMLNANGVKFNRLYIEGTAMEYGIAATASTFIAALHAYMGGVGTLFDLGAGINASVDQEGIVNPANFGTGPWFTDGSVLKLPNTRPGVGSLSPTVPRVATVKHGLPGPWVNFGAAGTGTNSPTYPPGYRINGERLELRGFATGTSTSTTVWTLPAGYRPTVLHNVAGGFGAQISIDVTGAIQLGSGTYTGLDGVSIPLT